VTSIVRALNLRPELYHRLLAHFHSTGVKLDRLAALWTQVVFNYYPEACSTCDVKMTPDMSTEHRLRQVVDILEPKVVVTEHRAHGCECPNCDTVTWASFPAEVKAPV
jgi:hypothetical protein